MKCELVKTKTYQFLDRKCKSKFHLALISSAKSTPQMSVTDMFLVQACMFLRSVVGMPLNSQIC